MAKVKRKGQFTGTVSKRSRFGEGHEAMTISFEGEAKETFAKAVAGQFVQLACRDLAKTRVTEPLLRRPISLGGIREYKDHTEIDLVFRIIGPGTSWLSEQIVGRQIDVMGPLGNGFKVPSDTNKKAILIGGGIGLPPMFALADMLEAAGVEKIAIGAARSASLIEDAIVIEPQVGSDQVLVPGDKLAHFIRSKTPSIITTDDGSRGFHGNAIEALRQYVENNPAWQEADIYCCGPEVMLKYAAKYAEEKGVECYVCMEAYMSCGIGLCQSCAVESKTSYVSKGPGPHYKLVCANGPVFNASEIIWDKTKS